MSLNLDKSTWKRVLLGDVATASKEKVDPTDGSIERYVAGEHMASNDLKIHRWGDIGDVELGPAFHRRFRPGQVLYGSRRTYLRKVAVADFDGVCANTTFVVETKNPDVLLQEFLPFIMTAEPFHAFAITESKGSVNPYVNWTDIERYEFDLPPLDEQKRLADLLWACEAHQVAVVKENLASTSLRERLLDQALVAEDVEVSPLESLIKSDTTITYGIVQAGSEVKDGVPYIRVSDMTDGQLSVEGMKRTAPEIAAKFKRSRVDAGDLVVALRGRTGLTLRVPDELAGANLTQGTARVAIDSEKINPEFVIAVMNSAWMASEINRNAKGSTFTELTLAALRNLPVPRFGQAKETELLHFLRAVNHAEVNTKVSLERLREMNSALLNDIFGGIS